MLRLFYRLTAIAIYIFLCFWDIKIKMYTLWLQQAWNFKLYTRVFHHSSYIYIYIKQSVSFLKFRGKTLRTQGRGGNTLDKTIVKKKIKSRETKKSKEMFNVYASFYLYPVAIIQVFVCIITLNSGEAYKGFLKHFQTFFLSGNWLPLLKHLK